MVKIEIREGDKKRLDNLQAELLLHGVDIERTDLLTDMITLAEINIEFFRLQDTEPLSKAEIEAIMQQKQYKQLSPTIYTK